MKNNIALHWFKKDLRLADNPSLNYLSKNYEKIIGVYIYDDINPIPKIGSASRVWLNEALKYLDKQLNGNLIVLRGNPKEQLSKIIEWFDINEISWNRCYEPWMIKRDKDLKSFFNSNLKVSSFNGSLLWEPWEILKNDGTPYKVFTPFYKRGCLEAKEPRQPEYLEINFFNHNFKNTDVSDLNLLTKKKWEKKIIRNWNVGENYSTEIMNNFYKDGLNDYADGRNFPIKKNVSRLSPYIHWGQVSPNTLWYELKKNQNYKNNNLEVFRSELGWREFAYHLLYHFPYLKTKNLKSNFDKFQWLDDEKNLRKWTIGMTGIPMVDAGMRELWQTGYMHNRSRMIVGSFLVKNLLINWQKGEEWFWDCLFDADAASNSASWQWIAGTGTDSSPYFRIFNPVTQGQRFDPTGEYIKKYVPELKEMPIKFLFNPWECPENIFENINIKLGKDYPFPIVDLKESRERALFTYAKLRKDNNS
ncbi:MAG: cryptochrome/photolyase family protein [Alphaproteobacteria bacterium]